MSKIRILFGILTVVNLSANISYAETRVSTIYTNYPISGNNINEIKQAIQASGLKDGNRSVFVAKTSPKFVWQYNFMQSELGCSIKSVDIDVEITYQIPQLMNYDSLDKANKDQWNSYYNAAYQHENGNANLGFWIAKEMELEAKNIPPKNNCGEVARAANMMISNIFNRHERNNITYETANSITQGTKLLAEK